MSHLVIIDHDSATRTGMVQVGDTFSRRVNCRYQLEADEGEKYGKKLVKHEIKPVETARVQELQVSRPRLTRPATIVQIPGLLVRLNWVVPFV